MARMICVEQLRSLPCKEAWRMALVHDVEPNTKVLAYLDIKTWVGETTKKWCVFWTPTLECGDFFTPLGVDNARIAHKGIIFYVVFHYNLLWCLALAMLMTRSLRYLNTLCWRNATSYSKCIHYLYTSSCKWWSPNHIFMRLANTLRRQLCQLGVVCIWLHSYMTLNTIYWVWNFDVYYQNSGTCRQP